MQQHWMRWNVQWQLTDNNITRVEIYKLNTCNTTTQCWYAETFRWRNINDCHVRALWKNSSNFSPLSLINIIYIYTHNPFYIISIFVDTLHITSYNRTQILFTWFYLSILLQSVRLIGFQITIINMYYDKSIFQ